ncbi:MAG: hypothetical protein WB807_07440, partial [Candidatus Dormiibacterota bacterium]
GATGASGATGATGSVPYTTIDGTAITGEHTVFGAGFSGTQITLTGSAVFSSLTSYVCYASDISNPTAVIVTYQSASMFTPTNAGAGDTVRFVCIGS